MNVSVCVCVCVCVYIHIYYIYILYIYIYIYIYIYTYIYISFQYLRLIFTSSRRSDDSYNWFRSLSCGYKSAFKQKCFSVFLCVTTKALVVSVFSSNHNNSNLENNQTF